MSNVMAWSMSIVEESWTSSDQSDCSLLPCNSHSVELFPRTHTHTHTHAHTPLHTHTHMHTHTHAHPHTHTHIHALTHRFVTHALQQSKVDLTWDEADPKRLKTTMRKYATSNSVHHCPKKFGGGLHGNRSKPHLIPSPILLLLLNS